MDARNTWTNGNIQMSLLQAKRWMVTSPLPAKPEFRVSKMREEDSGRNSSRKRTEWERSDSHVWKTDPRGSPEKQRNLEL